MNPPSGAAPSGGGVGLRKLCFATRLSWSVSGTAPAPVFAGGCGVSWTNSKFVASFLHAHAKRLSATMAGKRSKGRFSVIIQLLIRQCSHYFIHQARPFCHRIGFGLID